MMKASTVNNCKILIGCFLVTVLTSGTARLSSIYFVAAITRYNVDRKQASFPFVLTYMLKTLAAPLIAYIEQILGTKCICTIGCSMFTLGIFGCFFAEDILVITLLWGVMVGFSYGLAYNMLAPLLNHHFTERKSTANGFVLSGNCVGGILLPFITAYLIDHFGTSESFLILSAIVANSIPASLLIRSADFRPKHNDLKQDAIVNQGNNFKNDDKVAESLSDFSLELTCKNLRRDLDDNTFSGSSQHKKEKEKEITRLSSDEFISNVFPKEPDENIEEKKILLPDEASIVNKNSRSSMVEQDEVVSTIEKNENENESFFHQRKFTFRNFKIFMDPAYIAILFIIGVNSTVFTAVLTIILDFVRDKGVPEHLETYYVMVLPATDLIARIGSGYIIDKKYLTVANFLLITFLGQAVMLVAFVHISNYALLMICELILSFFFGLAVNLGISMPHEFVEEESRKMAISSRMMLYAPLSLTISPMIGFFRGGYGSYDQVFYILGTITFFCACASYFLPHLSRCKQSLADTNI